VQLREGKSTTIWQTLQPSKLSHLRRPILFRASSTNPVRSFQSKHISHPHANVLSSDAFARRFIRSDTDYSVYSQPRSSDPGENNAPLRSGMQGLDLAFYKGRSRYHTRLDTVPYTNGGEKSLWSMMEVAKGSGIELLNAYETQVDQGGVRDEDAPVYFDSKHNIFFHRSSLFMFNFSVFKSIVFVFPLINLLTFNIVILILGPIILVLLVVWKHIIIARKREIGSLPRSRAPHSRYFSLNPQSSESHRRDYNGVSSVPRSRTDRLVSIWGYGKFWIALVVTLGLEALLVFLYTVVNPFVSPKILSNSWFTSNVLTNSGSIFISIHRPALLPVPYLSLAQFRAQLTNLIAILLTKICLYDPCSR
jgi:hypothetical protein